MMVPTQRLLGWVLTSLGNRLPVLRFNHAPSPSPSSSFRLFSSSSSSASVQPIPPLPPTIPTIPSILPLPTPPQVAAAQAAAAQAAAAQTAAAQAAAIAASSSITMHDILVDKLQGTTSRLRVHLMPTDSTHLDFLLDQLHRRAAAKGAVFGMDGEWQVELTRHERNPVSLLQLSWEDDVFLIQLLHLNGEIPPALRRLLADDAIVKVGCNVANDVKRLEMSYGLETRGHMDLREITQGLGLVQCKRRNLSWLAKEFVGVEMDKTMQCSDWGNRELSAEQIKYSSIDAWVAGAIVESLYRQYRHQVGQPPCATSFCKRLVPQHKKRGSGGGGGGGGGGGRGGNKKQQQQQQQQNQGVRRKIF